MMTIMAQDNQVKIVRLELGPWEANAYIMVCQQTGESLLVDACSQPDEIIKNLEGTRLKYIVLTHNHMDHTGALAVLKSRYPVPVAVHAADAAGLPLKPDMFLDGGDRLSVGNLTVEVVHTPGHTPGGLCFRTSRYLISGDTLFPGGPGRTGSPESLKQIITSIVEKIFVLPDDTRVYPGHGEAAVLGEEKEAFAVFAARSHDPGLCGDALWLSS